MKLSQYRPKICTVFCFSSFSSVVHSLSLSVDILHHLAVLCCPLLCLQKDCKVGALLHTKHPRKHQQSHFIALLQILCFLGLQKPVVSLLYDYHLTSYCCLILLLLLGLCCLLAHACITNSQAGVFDISTAPPSGPRLEFQDTLQYSK